MEVLPVVASLVSVLSVLGGMLWAVAKLPDRKDVSEMIKLESPPAVQRILDSKEDKIDSLREEVIRISNELIRLSTKMDIYFGSKND